MDSCDLRLGAYKDGKSFADCRREAALRVPEISSLIETEGRVSWDYIMEKAGYDAVVYKLTLKYLRERGFDIGNHGRQYVSSYPA